MIKICFFNKGSVHYRKNIYQLLDKNLDVDFYFGDNRRDDIKKLDTSLLNNYKGELKNIFIGPFYWQKGVLSLLSKYDVIITPGDTYCLSTWILLLFSKIIKKRIFLWTHGAYGNEKFIKRLLCKLRVKLSAGCFLYGNFAKEKLINYGCNSKKLHVIYNSLDYDNQIKLRNKLKKTDLYERFFKNEDYNLFFIGRLTKVKKLDLLIYALKKLNDRGIKCNLTFIGSGSEIDILKTIAEKVNIADRVWFYGACYDESILGELIYNADLCVAPGNVGLTAMHSMTYGTPVCSHNNFVDQMPEFESIEEGKTGLFFRENDLDDLTRNLENWFKNNRDRDIIRYDCFRIIDTKYNPYYQINLIENIIKN